MCSSQSIFVRQRPVFLVVVVVFVAPCSVMFARKTCGQRKGKGWCSSSEYRSTDHRGRSFLFSQLQVQSSPTLSYHILYTCLSLTAFRHYNQQQVTSAVKPAGTTLNIESQQSSLKALYSTPSHLSSQAFRHYTQYCHLSSQAFGHYSLQQVTSYS